MALGIDPKIDYAFKRLFGTEQNGALLIHLINAVLRPKPGKEVVEVEILNPFNEKDFDDDKLSVVDVKARDQGGRRYNVEMQMLADQYFCKRLLYYWAKMDVQQMREGDPYEDLKPTFVIAFVNARVFPDAEAYHHAFSIRDVTGTLLFSGDFQTHILEIPKFRKGLASLTSPLDLWLYFLENAELLDPDVLPAALNQPVIQRAMKELAMLTKDEIERERYEARVKQQRDEVSRLRSARQESDAQARTEEILKNILFLSQLLKRQADRAALAKMSLEELGLLNEKLKEETNSAFNRTLPIGGADRA
jgi:predicted transposase/invertase (TIGR01784 family)